MINELFLCIYETALVMAAGLVIVGCVHIIREAVGEDGAKRSRGNRCKTAAKRGGLTMQLKEDST
jgi:hypothetical protein